MNDSTPTAPTAATEPSVFHVVEPLHRSFMWMKLIAGVSIAAGVLQCLTIVGAVIGWLPIWIGVLMWRGAKSLEESFASRDASNLSGGFEAMGKAVKLQGILTLIGLALTGLYVCVVIAVLIGTAINS